MHGWLFVCRALERCGAIAHLAEPVETSALRGRKRRAKTDRTDARWLRQLLCEGRLPEAWVPPEHVRQWRSRARLRNTLVDDRTSCAQVVRGAGDAVVIQRRADPLDDIGVHRSDRHAQLGKLTRQGSAPLRWALVEAAQSASHKGSPDYHDYHALKARGLTHTRATPTIARKLARRSYHILRALGPAALEPRDHRSDQAHPSPMRSKRAASSSSDRGTHAPRGGPQKTERPQSLHRNDRSTIKSPAANPRGRGPR